MDILEALKQEQGKLQHQLKAIETAIAVLNASSNGAHREMASLRAVSRDRTAPRQTMSAAVRTKISKATKARWAKYRAEKARKAK